MMRLMSTCRRGASLRKWILALACVLSWAGAVAPPGAMAQELEIEHDARLEGYGNDAKVALDDKSTAMTWVGFTVIALIALLGLFKDAKRSHLD
jgi:hypothetical protein